MEVWNGGEHHSGQAQESQPDTDVGPQFLFSPRTYGAGYVAPLPLRTKLTLINSLSATTTTTTAATTYCLHRVPLHPAIHPVLLLLPVTPTTASLIQTNIVALTSLAANGERILSSSRDLLIAPDDKKTRAGRLVPLPASSRPRQP